MSDYFKVYIISVVLIKQQAENSGHTATCFIKKTPTSHTKLETMKATTKRLSRNKKNMSILLNLYSKSKYNKYFPND